MGGDDSLRLSGFPFSLRLADTDDRDQAGRQYGVSLGPDHGVAFAVIGAALGMPQDDIACTGVFQHGRGNIARMGPGLMGMTILTTD